MCWGGGTQTFCTPPYLPVFCSNRTLLWVSHLHSFLLFSSAYFGSHVSTHILHFLSAYQCLPMLSNLHMLFPFVSICFRIVLSSVLFRIPVSIKDPDFSHSFWFLSFKQSCTPSCTRNLFSLPITLVLDKYKPLSSELISAWFHSNTSYLPT